MFPSAVRFAAIAVLLVAGVAWSEPPPRNDAYGDPLPDDALARLGTSRLRLGGYGKSAAFSPDGKWIVVNGQASGGRFEHYIRLLDTSTGKEAKRLLSGSELDCFAFSGDGKVRVSHILGPI